MSSAIREFQGFLNQSLRHPRFWAFLGAMIAMFSIIGPFGTFERLSLLNRFLYWGGTMFGSWAIAILTLGLMVGALSRFKMSLNTVMIIGAFVTAFPIALFLQWIVPTVFDDGSTNTFWVQYFYVLPVTLTFSIITNFLVRPDPESDTATATAIIQDNPLLERIPFEKRGPLKYMSAEDHYVKVVTTKGSELILMRMADAEKAVAHLPGIRVHRSHWVNSEYAASNTRQNGQPFIVMDDGAKLPVSRSYTKHAREVGLI